jgi:hypothetical protein
MNEINKLLKIYDNINLSEFTESDWNKIQNKNFILYSQLRKKLLCQNNIYKCINDKNIKEPNASTNKYDIISKLKKDNYILYSKSSNKLLNKNDLENKLNKNPEKYKIHFYDDNSDLQKAINDSLINKNTGKNVFKDPYGLPLPINKNQNTNNTYEPDLQKAITASLVNMDNNILDPELQKAITASLVNMDNNTSDPDLQKAIIDSLINNDSKLKEKILSSLKTSKKLKTDDNNFLKYIDSVKKISKKKSKNNIEFINLVMKNLLPNYNIYRQKGDGACMFRSFHQILGIEHDILRTKVVNYICNHWNFYKNYCLNINGQIFNSADEYHNFMIKNDSWGNNPELNALCVIFCINVIVFDINKEDQRINVTNIEQDSDQTIHLIYSHYNGDNGHYDIILP